MHSSREGVLLAADRINLAGDGFGGASIRPLTHVLELSADAVPFGVFRRVSRNLSQIRSPRSRMCDICSVITVGPLGNPDTNIRVSFTMRSSHTPSMRCGATFVGATMNSWRVATLLILPHFETRRRLPLSPYFCMTYGEFLAVAIQLNPRHERLLRFSITSPLTPKVFSPNQLSNSLLVESPELTDLATDRGSLPIGAQQLFDALTAKRD